MNASQGYESPGIAGSGAIAGDADDDDAVVDLGRVHAKPRSRRAIDPAEAAQIVEDRFEQIDRHDHVDMLGAAGSLALEL